MKVAKIGFARKAVSLVAASAMVVTMVVPGTVTFAAADDGDVVEVSNVSQLRDLAQSPSAYTGKTVKLMRDLTLSGEWTPIGTANTPFTGVFDGDNHSIAGLQVKGYENLGLFGYVGVGGTIKNLHITNGDNNSDPSAITANSSSRVIRNVGSVAGYVYGQIGDGSSAIENCSSEATVQVTSTMKPDANKLAEFTPEGQAVSDGKAALADGYTDQGITIEYIGGVVGYSAGSVIKTSYAGKLTARTDEDPASDDYTTVGKSVGGVVGQAGGYTTTEEIEGTTRALERAHYPQIDGTYSRDAESVSRIEECTNADTVTVIATGDGGLDRFGSSVSASFVNAGGIAGNALANVSSCENTGDVIAKTTTATGGIVGSLRSVNYTGTSTVAYDAGEYYTGEKDGSKVKYTYVSTGPTLAIEDCVTASTVSGRAQVGGIVGETGTHTQVKFCKTLSNGKQGQVIVGNRWNKPMTGGIAGMVHGDVSHCYNRVDCKTETGGGYYVAGLVGSLSRFTTDSSGAANSPIPELEASYSTGTVIADGSYKQAGICGENGGTIHDCYFIKDTVLNIGEADDENPYRPMVAENEGTVADSVKEVTAGEMKSKSFCGMVSAPTSLDEYRANTFFVPDIAGGKAINDGYPVFYEDRAAVESAGDIALKPELDSVGLSASGVGSATYQADGNPIPVLSIVFTEDEVSTNLVQGADYYVIPDANVVNSEGGTRDISEIGDTTFNAGIVGIGDYRGNVEEGSSFTAPYKVGKGQFSTCSVTIASKMYNFYPQFPDVSAADDKDKDIVIRDAAGNIVPFDQYVIPADPGNWVDYKRTSRGKGDGKSHVGYEMEFTAKADSNYKGVVYGYFQISKAELFRNEKTKFAGFSWNGQTWQWKNSYIVSSKTVDGYLYQTDKQGNEIRGMSIPYSGDEIRPVAGVMQYEDANGELRTLRQGTDYRVVYGDPGQNDLISTDKGTVTDVASGTGSQGTRPCVTVRFQSSSDKCNFLNYQNFFFDIVKADISDSSQATVTIPASVKVGDSNAIKVVGYTGKTIGSSNYDVKFSSVSNGKVTVTVTGKKNLKGSFSKTVAVASPSSSSKTTKGVTYSVSNAGKKTVTVSKVKTSARSVTIPATVKISKTTYKVTAIAKKAFANSKNLTRVTIGKNVSKIGAKAFYGCKKLKTVEIKSAKLTKKSIGKKAFSKIHAKAMVKCPKKKVKAYKKYLRKAGLSAKAKVTK